MLMELFLSLSIGKGTKKKRFLIEKCKKKSIFVGNNEKRYDE